MLADSHLEKRTPELNRLYSVPPILPLTFLSGVNLRKTEKPPEVSIMSESGDMSKYVPPPRPETLTAVSNASAIFPYKSSLIKSWEPSEYEVQSVVS